VAWLISDPAFQAFLPKDKKVEFKGGHEVFFRQSI
jgi:hypothetical protein